MVSRIIHFPKPNNPRPPATSIPVIWRFIALVVAYVRHKQAEFKLPVILPQQWGIRRVLDVSVHGIPASDGDRVAAIRKAMDAKRPRMSIVDIADTATRKRLAGEARAA